MPSQARNQNNVPPEDLPFFIAATTAGIRQQLREAEIPAGGLKYELYLRLRANGLRIYNDIRGPHDPENSDSSDWDSEEDSDEDEEGPDDDESESGEPEDGWPEEDDSSSDSSSDDDPNEPPSGVRKGRKRKRVDDGADAEEDLEDPEAPKPVSLADMPAELAIDIVRNLDAGGVFNLVAASPQQFLLGNVNAFMLEAIGRRSASGRNGLSLLEWVVVRVGNEVDFRTNHRGLVRHVVDAYLATYPSYAAQHRSEEHGVEQIMYWLRGVGVGPVLGAAVMEGKADIVQLLIVLGEDVNERTDDVSPLEEATVLIKPSLLHMNSLHIVFALLAAGADNTSTREDYPEPEPATAGFSTTGVAATAQDRFNQIMEGPMLTPLNVEPRHWPVIQNPRDLTIRQFLADERSPFMDRVMMALILIITRDTKYPYFEGYEPEGSEDGSQGPVA
ncbi:hypothetical protein INS49_002939 [Diaporthe citri]|uniref:uncharacterized protein n=1 Tax=Diaporthe citri TaxID=83186 RepID=UPI001C81E1D6|nr:uncharacterized protein INS49_002939 [Diaporthe citri]KAG6368725.1 hypothetical protein INS49_002939 [Diaporthe citri]